MYVINNVSTHKNSFTMDPETKWVIEVLLYAHLRLRSPVTGLFN